MSKLSPLSLPRFDAKALARTAQARQAYPGTQEPQAEFVEAPDEDPAIAVDADGAAMEEIAPPLPETPQVDTGVLLASLEKSLLGMEQNAMAICHQAVSEFLIAAFPRLSEAFLAEEVVAALKDMAPPKVERLNVRVPSELEASFQRTLQQSPRLSDICEVHPLESHDEMIVDVDWSEGGLRFDMDQFLTSSLGRLAGPQTP